MMMLVYLRYAFGFGLHRDGQQVMFSLHLVSYSLSFSVGETGRM